MTLLTHQIFFLAWIALTFEAVDAGAGIHQWNLSVQELAHQYRVVYSHARKRPL